MRDMKREGGESEVTDSPLSTELRGAVLRGGLGALSLETSGHNARNTSLETAWKDYEEAQLCTKEKAYLSGSV